jgi:hypothetical protein
MTTLGSASLVDVKKASWEIGNFDMPVTGFAKSAFTFNATSMAGNDGRYFMSLGSGNTTLVLNYKSASTWNTGSGNWTSAMQWENEALPENGDEVEFAGPGGTSTNNFATGNLSSISGFNFVEGAGAYTVSGNTLQIGEDGIINASSNLQTIAMDLTAGEILAVNAAAAGVEDSRHQPPNLAPELRLNIAMVSSMFMMTTTTMAARIACPAATPTPSGPPLA